MSNDPTIKTTLQEGFIKYEMLSKLLLATCTKLAYHLDSQQKNEIQEYKKELSSLNKLIYEQLEKLP